MLLHMLSNGPAKNTNFSSTVIANSRNRKVAIEVRDKRIRVSLEGKEIYSVKYTDPLDEVKGLVFKLKTSSD